MTSSPLARHSGVTLVELMIFLAILGVVTVLVLPLLFTASQTQLQQQTVAAVEQNGAQAMQEITLRVRGAERILSPTAAQSGPFLALQTSSGALNPIIIGLMSGSLMLIQRDQMQPLTSSQVAVVDFVARNTSVSAKKQSVVIAFHVSRALRQSPKDAYLKNFETAISLLPADLPTGNVCKCSVPICPSNNALSWQVCVSGACADRSAVLQCP